VNAISKLNNNDIPTSEKRAEENYLLPKKLIPISYDISITPYLESPLIKLYTFDGKINY
jgi:hypothetical protein